MSADLEARVKKLESGGSEVWTALWVLFFLFLFGFFDPSPIFHCPPKYKWCQPVPAKVARSSGEVSDER